MADMIAVGFYLLGVIPLVGIALVDLGVLGGTDAKKSMTLHATFVGIFLVVAHVAMIFGMLSPAVLGHRSSVDNTMNMDAMDGMSEMTH